ncbi:hypothetical protein HU200_036440 [Digitaria exilis]|uniref:F-box domain-containing protein n=1 Tax=Digitaria exilis TaxID=1010633 RepID=A0A835BFU6_9POAL|nr:hypothetical protein HU200_036440 [Digitaria exilis]
MDAGEGGEPMTYDQVEDLFNSMEGPSAQERIDCIFSSIISLLPPPFVPAPATAASDDSDNERFSLTSSDSEATDAGADPPAVHPAALGDGVDHISRLPDALLSNIISRLATKEAARTVVLSTRWRALWAATPLLVDDAHLGGADGPTDIPLVRALSRCVAAHPGPVRGVRITRVSFNSHEYALRRLVADLADKDVQDLILFNRPWPLNMPLPEDILRCASLERLYLGVWHLKVVMDWNSTLDEVVLQDAPCLERLILQTMDTRRPRLEVLGFLDLKLHELQIGGIAIKAIPSESVNSGHDLEFWESLGSCECLESHLKALMVHGYLVHNNEIGFLQYIIREGKALKAVGVDPSPENKVAIDLLLASFCESNATSGDVSSGDIFHANINSCFNFQNAIDVTLDNPFCVDDVLV